jgi:hypothetical protein
MGVKRRRSCWRGADVGSTCTQFCEDVKLLLVATSLSLGLMSILVFLQWRLPLLDGSLVVTAAATVIIGISAASCVTCYPRTLIDTLVNIILAMLAHRGAFCQCDAPAKAGERTPSPGQPVCVKKKVEYLILIASEVRQETRVAPGRHQ